MLKTLGYSVSSPLLVLFAGIVTSIVGMFVRWLSHLHAQRQDRWA